MPPRKSPATTTAPALSSKSSPRQLAYTKDAEPKADVHTEARTSRTQDYMAAERLREAELEKLGYCF